MKDFGGRVAVITGAGSGIGRALALAMADEGARIAISDIDEASLDVIRRELESRGTRVFAEVVDVSDRDAVFRHADNVVETFGAAHIVFNNAGVALTSSVRNMDIDDLQWLMNINFWGVVYGTKAFLPHLEEAKEGHIVNIASVFGIVGIPTMSAYCAAKFAVRGFTESLRQELDLAETSVSCSVVCPGGIRTNIAKRARMPTGDDLQNVKARGIKNFHAVARTSPEEAARTIVAGVRDNKRRILVGADAFAIDAIQRSAPGGYQRLVSSMAAVLARRGKR